MKKGNFLLIAIFCISIHSLIAQENSFGIKGGLNMSSIGGDSEGVSVKAGAHFGVFLQSRASNSLAIQSGLIYSMQGAAIDNDSKLNYNYLNVPIILKLYPAEQGFNINFGPQLGFLLSGKIATGDIDLDVKSQLNDVDVALGIGLGYDADNIVLDVRYNLGLNSSAADDSTGTFPLRTFQLGIGVIL